MEGVWWETWMSGGGVVGDLDEWRECGGTPG